jgi:hypothetical protein
MEMIDIDGDGIEELLVGSDDFEMRAFKDEDIAAEITYATTNKLIVRLKYVYHI